jgi:hypothetical protein
MACDDKPKEPESIRVKTEFKIINQLEYESDLTVELKSGDGQIITIKPGEEQVVHSYTETCYSKDLAPIASLPYNDPVLSAEMKAYGKIVPNVILEHDRWEFDSEDLSNRKDSDIDYKYTATLTVTNELLSALDGPEPDTYVTENYKIVNRIASDIVVELRFGDGQVTTIRPGEEQMIGSMEYHYEWGVAYSRDRKLLDAEMKIDGDIVPNSVWWHENQDSIRENGEDDYHYTLLYTLTVTDELLERAFAGG